MEWLWIIVAACVALYLLWQWRSRKAAASASAALTSTPLGLNIASDRELMLATFRRELANYMVRLDPDGFLRFYQKAQVAEAAIGSADQAVREAELTIITNKISHVHRFRFRWYTRSRALCRLAEQIRDRGHRGALSQLRFTPPGSRENSAATSGYPGRHRRFPSSSP
jgi:hypothetical protein